MARIKDSSVRDVVAAADMVEVVSTRTPLRRASGTRFTGRCPFHEEKTPSFSVNPVDKLYYCFGCGKGGDVVSFVRETENLDFVGAIEWLAERFRIQLEYEETSPRQDEARRRRERLYAVLDEHATGCGADREDRRLGDFRQRQLLLRPEETEIAESAEGLPRAFKGRVCLVERPARRRIPVRERLPHPDLLRSLSRENERDHETAAAAISRSTRWMKSSSAKR